MVVRLLRPPYRELAAFLLIVPTECDSGKIVCQRFGVTASLEDFLRRVCTFVEGRLVRALTERKATKQKKTQRYIRRSVLCCMYMVPCTYMQGAFHDSCRDRCRRARAWAGSIGGDVEETPLSPPPPRTTSKQYQAPLCCPFTVFDNSAPQKNS